MFDNDTLIVTYDQERGEPRSGRSRKVDAKQEGLGDCIDCNFCVQVCPVGIDIRNGLQYECISCGLCVDACNSIMDKMNYPRGLIRFTTQNGLAQHWTKHQVIQKILRPRVLIYSALLLLLSAGLVASLAMRPAFKVDVNRDRGVMSRLVVGGKIENVYQLQITNVTEVAESYHVTVSGLEGLTMASKNQFTVDPANERLVAVSLQLPDGEVRSGTHPIMFEIEALGSKERVTQKSIFYMPR
jgi:cytochrome c oxidase accessory protein FixG